MVPVREVVVPGRLSRPHPVARAYRDDRDNQEVSTAHVARAVRIVHALALAVEDAGLSVLFDTSSTPQGQFRVRAGPWCVSFRISEKAAPGGKALPYWDSRTFRAMPAWQKRRQTQFVSTGKLTVSVGGAYGHGSGRQLRFSDGRRHTLEDVLSGVVQELEMELLEHQQDETESQRRERELDQRWQLVLADAQARATEAFRSETLSKRAAVWEAWQQQAGYVAALGQHTDTLSGEERAGVEEWLDWCRARLTATDPRRLNHTMPTTPTSRVTSWDRTSATGPARHGSIRARGHGHPPHGSAGDLGHGIGQVIAT